MKKNNSMTRLLTRWESLLVLIFIGVFVINSQLSPYFLDTRNLLDASFNFTEKAIIALPMIFIIIAGDIDISVASIIALSSVFMGLASSQGAGSGQVVFIGLFTGFLAGALNGAIITRIKIPAIAVTIGTYSLYRGIAYAILGDQAFTHYPKGFDFLGQGYFFGTQVPFELILFALLALVFGFLLHKTTFGRRVYALGNNPTATAFSGIRNNRLRLMLFAINGLMSGLAAVLLTSRIGSTRPNIANGWELEIITTVVLGGVSINGGKGNIFGVLIAIFLLGFLKYGMALINIPGKVMNIVTGLLLILAILLPRLLERRREA